MKQEDKQYEKWLTEVKSNQPILENPEELTATILNRISGISPERKRRKFLIGAWASGIAASLLLLLFINDTCSLLSLTGQKCKMNMITGQTAFHYLTTGKKCDCWKEHLSILSIYATPEIPEDANLTSHQKKTIKIDRI